MCDIDHRHGGRLRQITIGSRAILVDHADSPLDWGLYPMAPFAGRVRGAALDFDGTVHRLEANAAPHAIHGTVFDAEWSIERADATSVVMNVGTGDGWPFAGRVTHTVTVSDTTVRCELTIRAHERMPVQLGWHPWFARPRSVRAGFAAMLSKDVDGITTLERVAPAPPPVDDCFIEPDHWPRVDFGDTVIEIASDCPYWVRYDAPGGHVCIEPQSGPPNGVNTVPRILEAGSSWSRWMEIRALTDQ